MSSEKHWYLISYDIRDQKRWSKVYKKVKGQGERVQFSVFRANMSRTELENFRFELDKIMKDEDDLLIIRLCQGCAKRVLDTRGADKWKTAPPKFEIF